MEDIKIVEKQELGDPGPTMVFIFTMITMLFWGLYAGIFKGNTSLVIGLIQLACFPAYLTGAIIFFMKNDSVNGNAFLIFATLFGGVGGVCNIAAHFGQVYSWGLDGTLSAIPFIWGGISILPVLVLIRKAPALSFLVFAAAAIFLILIGFISLGLLPTFLNVVVKWLGLFVAVGGFYNCLDGLLTCGGAKGLPQIPALFKN